MMAYERPYQCPRLLLLNTQHWATETPPSVNQLYRLDLEIAAELPFPRPHSVFHRHELIFVSTKPTAGEKYGLLARIIDVIRPEIMLLRRLGSARNGSSHFRKIIIILMKV